MLTGIFVLACTRVIVCDRHGSLKWMHTVSDAMHILAVQSSRPLCTEGAVHGLHSTDSHVDVLQKVKRLCHRQVASLAVDIGSFSGDVPRLF